MLDHDVIFGKNVIETLSEGMYDNSLFLFREYVQNAADAIDAAIRKRILGEGEGQIVISIDPEKRLISFEDNGTGIATADFKAMLANIGNSVKDRKTDKGFRGIGRLGGLGYCQKVRFETSAKGESVKSFMEWDARNLHELLANPDEKIDAGQLIKRITSTWEEECDVNAHFFKVSLLNVNPTSDELLDVDEVKKYLSMVAPVPFDYQKFPFTAEIENFLKTAKIPKPHEYLLYLNDDEVRKGYETPLKIGDDKPVEILDVVCQIIKDTEGAALGWYWFCVSKFEGVLPRACYQRGFRLRKANIQIGEADCLTNHPKRGQALWKEDRGNTYFLGEIHVLDENLIPNSRRDYFNQDEACRRFESALKQKFRGLHNLYHDASKIRSGIAKIEAATEAQKAFAKKEKRSGFFDAKAYDQEKQKVMETEGKAQAAKASLEKMAKRPEFLNTYAKETEKNPLEKIIEAYDVSAATRGASKPLVFQDNPQNGFQKDKLKDSEKRILDIVLKVIEQKLTLSPEELSAIRDEIIKRIVRR